MSLRLAEKFIYRVRCSYKLGTRRDHYNFEARVVLNEPKIDAAIEKAKRVFAKQTNNRTDVTDFNAFSVER